MFAWDTKYALSQSLSYLPYSGLKTNFYVKLSQISKNWRRFAHFDLWKRCSGIFKKLRNIVLLGFASACNFYKKRTSSHIDPFRIQIKDFCKIFLFVYNFWFWMADEKVTSKRTKKNMTNSEIQKTPTMFTPPY